VHLDCDPGHDDAIALLLGARYECLVGITTVGGNAPLDQTTRNALTCCAFFGIDAPVHPGAPRPLLREPSHAAEIHGSSGLDGPAPPADPPAPARGSSTDAILEAASATTGLWLVATGPLTNIATALLARPDLATTIGGLAIMGGSTTFGNWTPAAEFNFWQDPEAAEIVLSAGIPKVRIVGLNVTHQVLVRDTDVEAVRCIDSPLAAYVSDLYEYFIDSHERHFFGRREAPLHDPCALLAAIRPELFEFTPMHVSVETEGCRSRGAMIADQRGTKQVLAPNVDVATSVNAELVRTEVLEAVRVLSERSDVN
jgi:inosine-uridine nucleoside N-ribohydrolase